MPFWVVMSNAIEKPYTVKMLSPAGRKALKAYRAEWKARTQKDRNAARQRRMLAMTEFTYTDSVIFSTLALGS